MELSDWTTEALYMVNDKQTRVIVLKHWNGYVFECLKTISNSHSGLGL